VTCGRGCLPFQPCPTEPRRGGSRRLGMAWDSMGWHGRQRELASDRVSVARKFRGFVNGLSDLFRVLPRVFGKATKFMFCSFQVNNARGDGCIEGRRQTACKPGSVRTCFGGGTTIPLGRVLRRASRDQPGRRGGNAPAALAGAAVPIRSCSRWGLPCRPCCQGRGALLPHRFALARGAPHAVLARAVCFLWHCPWGRPRRRLAGTVFPWSPDFPLRLCSGRPAVWRGRDARVWVGRQAVRAGMGRQAVRPGRLIFSQRKRKDRQESPSFRAVPRPARYPRQQ
jgi:hypothetical protein